MAWQINNLFNFKKRAAVKKILRAEKPELIVANNLMGLGFLLPGLFQKLKIKYVQILHDVQLIYPTGLMFYSQEKIIDNWKAKIYQRLTRHLFKSPTLVVSPSKWLLDLYAQRNFFTNSKKIVARNPLDFILAPIVDAHISNNNAAIINDTASPDFHFLYVGQMEISKGIIFLIETFKKIANPNLKLEVVGDGTQLEIAKKLAGHDQRIKFHGRLEGAALAPLFTKSQGLIIPSLVYENSPMIIYEAALAHLPFIASRIGGIPELANAWGGLLFTPGDEVDLINKINDFLKNYLEIKSAFPKTTPTPENYAQKILSNI